MIIGETGILFCLVDPTQPQHSLYKRSISRYAQPLITTWPCLAEAMYLTSRRGGWAMQKRVGDLLLEGLFVTYAIAPDLIPRLLELMEQYRDRPMDFADASLVLLAEQTGYRQILTLDSDFFFYRIHGRESFEVLPGEEQS
ncbi:type II toxin-antitoxin system VapC family toxin [Sodalinema gerasimenkoae]|uniref:type II toxin-antitoxin system VapC family toxin n=1 Tax=Sodalinema gerasimenkoae TaxID=2862348 RepID=UPI00135B7E55|nr:PIN domain-containing protein [Sodalinema gerasimenkoae]